MIGRLRGLIRAFFWAGLFTWPGSLGAVDLGGLMDQGKTQFEKGEFGKALQIFHKVRKEDPSNSLAREYVSKCTEKIMEAAKGEKMKKAIQKGETSSSTILPQEPKPVWAMPKAPPKEAGGTKPKWTPNPSKGRTPSGEGLTRERRPSRFIVKRDQLVEGYKNKILEGPSIEIVRKWGRVEIVAYMNRLFLPFSDSLAPDAIPAIESIARELREDSGKKTILRAVDSLSPAVRHQMLDLPTRRVSILFSYLMHATLGEGPRDNRGTFTAADFDD